MNDQSIMSRSELIRAIVELEQQRHNLDEPSVRRRDARLYHSACEQFGTWATALHYAGVPPRRIQTDRWSPTFIIRKLRRMCWYGYGLRARQVHLRDSALYIAVRKHFGGWRKALVAAGINPENASGYERNRARRCWPAARVIEAIHARQAQGLSLRRVDVCFDDQVLLVTAKQRFGSWTRALLAAGIDPTGIVQGYRKAVPVDTQPPVPASG